MASGPHFANVERTQFVIEGMSCAACAAKIEEALEAQETVQSARVNFATSTSLILHEPDVPLRNLTEIVDSLGFRALPESDRQSVQASSEAALRRRAIPALVIALFAMLSMFVRFPAIDWIIAALTTVSVWWAGWGFHRSAKIQIARRSLAMDTLISLGAIAAWSWSVAVLVIGADQGLHFGGASSIIAFVLLGKWWEARALKTSGDALESLAQITPDHVQLTNGEILRLDQIVVGTEFIVAPGERIATDSEVLQGHSEVDASQSTGETSLIEVSPGSLVSGGFLNCSGALTLRATAVGNDTHLARIAQLVEEAQATRAPIQRIADQVAAKFVPAVILISVGTFFTHWLATGITDNALIASVAVLVVSCPCSLGLATPLAIFVGTGRAAQLGVMVAGAHILDSSKAIDTVVFDKTGTITKGTPFITDVLAPNESKLTLLTLATELESRSGHPIAQAFKFFPSTPSEIQDFTMHPGKGISGLVNGIEVRIGKAELFDRIPQTLTASSSQESILFIGRGSIAEAKVTLGDEVRTTSAEAIELLRQLKLEVALLSGDSYQETRNVADKVGILDIKADVLPEDKHRFISDLQSEGKCVAMVGDGINDTPALAASDLGIALQSGTAAAQRAADLTIITNDPRAVADGIALSRKTLRVIKTNLVWAFSYNLIAMPLAITGLLRPTHAAFAMALSSLLVVTNSLSLRRFTSLSSESPA